MLKKFGKVMTNVLQRWMPEPFVFALILTLVTSILALVYTDAGVSGTLDSWYKGFWLLLEFGMQIILILVAGYAVALSPLFTRAIDWLANVVHTPGAVYTMVIIVGALFGLISFGLVILAAILAREMARRVGGLDYPFLVACAYLAGHPWVGGLSSSIPLMLGTENNFMIQSGMLDATISVSYTLGSLLNALYLAAFFIGMPLIMWWMRPKDSEAISMQSLSDPGHEDHVSVKQEADDISLTGKTVSDRLNSSFLLQWSIALMALFVIGRHFLVNDQGLDLNIMIFIFITIGLVLHGTPMRFVIAMRRACSNISGIVYQYPFYAGIMGIMLYTGLGSAASTWLASHASIHTLPVIAQMTGAVINFAIPSAGGEWAVVGPAFVEAAKSIGASLPPDQLQALIARIAMSVAYGEASSNLLQPFFILIILPVMGAGVRVQARDVMGYLVVPFIYLSIVIALLVSFLPL